MTHKMSKIVLMMSIWIGLVWGKSFVREIGDTTGTEIGKFIFTTPDSGYIIIGNSNSFPQIDENIMIAIRLKNIKDIEFARGFTTGEVKEAIDIGSGIVILSDSGLIKLGYDLSLQWARNYIGNKRHLHLDNDRGFILILDNKIVKTDSLGVPVWVKILKLPKILNYETWNGVMDCLPTNDSNYIAVVYNRSYYSSNAGYRFTITKFNTRDTIIWNLHYQSGNWPVASYNLNMDWILYKGNGFIVAENTNDIGTYFHACNLVINNSGNSVTVMSPNNSLHYKVSFDANGGMLLMSDSIIYYYDSFLTPSGKWQFDSITIEGGMKTLKNEYFFVGKLNNDLGIIYGDTLRFCNGTDTTIGYPDMGSLPLNNNVVPTFENAIVSLYTPIITYEDIFFSIDTLCCVEDDMSPSIDSTTVMSNTPSMGPFEIRTKAWDDFSGIKYVHLYYKRLEDIGYSVVEMFSMKDGWYIGEIPEVAFAEDTVRYFIMVSDKAGNIAIDPQGGAASPYLFVAGTYSNIDENAGKTVDLYVKFDPISGYLMLDVKTEKGAIISQFELFDVSGRKVYELKDKYLPNGTHIVTNKSFKNGIYFYIMVFEGMQKRGKCVLLKN